MFVLAGDLEPAGVQYPVPRMMDPRDQLSSLEPTLAKIDLRQVPELQPPVARRHVQVDGNQAVLATHHSVLLQNREEVLVDRADVDGRKDPYPGRGRVGDRRGAAQLLQGSLVAGVAQRTGDLRGVSVRPGDHEVRHPVSHEARDVGRMVRTPNLDVRPAENVEDRAFRRPEGLGDHAEAGRELLVGHLQRCFRNRIAALVRPAHRKQLPCQAKQRRQLQPRRVHFCLRRVRGAALSLRRPQRVLPPVARPTRPALMTGAGLPRSFRRPWGHRTGSPGRSGSPCRPAARAGPRSRSLPPRRRDPGSARDR